MSIPASLRAGVAGVGLLLPCLLQAQTDPVPAPRLHYWIAAGAGIAMVNDNSAGFSILPDGRVSLAAVASVQYRSLVFSARGASAGLSPTNAWDLSVLAGVGTSQRPAVSGSVGAGIGRQDDNRGQSSIALPVELQLSWRITRWVGAGLYGFGSFGGPNDFLGGTFMIRMGRLQ